MNSVNITALRARLIFLSQRKLQLGEPMSGPVGWGTPNQSAATSFKLEAKTFFSYHE
jgi:hypothetical protein